MRILEYLGGIETSLSKTILLVIIELILEYLGGIETWLSYKSFPFLPPDFRIPRRDWNYKLFYCLPANNQDFRIPRRDWNLEDQQDICVLDTDFRIPRRDWNK